MLRMKHLPSWLIVAVFCSGCVATPTPVVPVKSGPKLVLAARDNPTLRCPVMVATNATECERYAADELAGYLGRMLGTNMTVIAERTADDAGWAIRLAHDPALGSDSYRIQMRSAERELLITGGRPRGLLMGVYGLLADQLGCRWYTPDIDYIPAVSNLALPFDFDVSMTPPLEYRHTDWAEANNPDWAARNRINAGSGLGAKHGGGIAFSPFVHTFNAILDARSEFAAHPEYFAMIHGVRTNGSMAGTNFIPGNVQLCLSNTNVLKVAVQRAKEWAAAMGGNGILSVSQNDDSPPCECPECAAIDKAEGSQSGSIIRFVNAIAEEVEKEYPRATVETLAYHYSQKPCKTRPRHNVIVRLCSIECCWAHPLDKRGDKVNERFMRDLKGWNQLTDRLYIWDYTTDYDQFFMPFPNLNTLDKNMRIFVKNGVKGVFEEGNYNANGELAELRTWLIAQLLWNPDLDSQTLQRDYVAHVYGPCAKLVQDFLDIQRDAIIEGDDHVEIFEGPDKRYLNAAVMRACDAKLAAAEDIAIKSGDAALIKRITLLRVPVWFIQFAMGRDGLAARRNTARHLVAAGKEFGFVQWGFLAKPWSTLEEMLLKSYTNYPFQVETVKPTPMAWGPASGQPFLGSVLFRNGANSFGLWDTGFDDKKGTMEVWVWCGPATTNHCKGRGSLFDIRSPRSKTGHRVWIDVDVEKGAFIPKYESWAGWTRNRIVGKPMTTGAWHHVSATWDATGKKGVMNLYEDTQLAGTAPYKPTDCSGERAFYVGLEFNTGIGVASSFGPIDEVRLSDVVRQPALHKSVYETDANTRLLLHFDEPEGMPITDSSGIVREELE